MTFEAMTSAQLVSQIKGIRGDDPNFVLLLGAGCSITSGIPTGIQMMEDWRNMLYRQYAENIPDDEVPEPVSDWFANQTWYESDSEYGHLFERMYQSQAARRNYIEHQIENKLPSWGYAYLTNLIAKKIFNIVLTTNFDDLINESCYAYSSALKPMVAAFDSAFKQIHLNTSRPKIVKLHGDYLFDDIKITSKQTLKLEDSSKDVLRNIARDWGLIVIGFAGRDRSIMQPIQELLNEEGSFPYHIYWCLRPSDIHKPSVALHQLMAQFPDRVHVVRISGFDELMAEMNDSFGFGLPEALRNPFRSAFARVSGFLKDDDDITKRDGVIKKDVDQVLEAIEKIPMPMREELPVYLRARSAKKCGHLVEAAYLFKIALGHDPTDQYLESEYTEILNILGRTEELVAFANAGPFITPNKIYVLLRAGRDEDAIKLADKRLEAVPNDHLTRINKAIALRRLKRPDDMKRELDELRSRGAIDNPYVGYAYASGISALENDVEAAIKNGWIAIEQGQMVPSNFKEYPVFDHLRKGTSKNAIRFRSFLDNLPVE